MQHDNTPVVIRPCEARDLDAVEASIPTGNLQLHHYRYRQQQAENSLYLIAWIGDDPIGHLDLHWRGYRQSCPASLLDYAEVNGLVVIPAWQSRGIGTMLIAAAERLLCERGLTAVCLGVTLDNTRARALYERLGYAEWDGGISEESGTFEDATGQMQTYYEQVVYLTKDLAVALK